MIKKHLTALLLLLSAVAQANPLHTLKNLCPPDDTLRIVGSLSVGGIIVSDCASKNMELNPNVSYAEVDLSVNDATAYLEASDASCGVRIRFSRAAENTLRRYDAVLLDLAGCLLVRESHPDRLTIKDFGAKNIVSVQPGTAADLPRKERTVASLTDEDLYTFVTIPEAEMVFKSGTFTDIYEPYGQYTPKIHDDPLSHKKYYDVSGRMDGWASLLRDREGNTIYMLVNLLCTWRRDGNMVPRGLGPISGIVVHTPMRRYGGNMGRYSLRPVDRKDIVLSKKRNSPWKILTGWELDGTQGQQLEFEYLGVQGGVWKNGKKGDRVLADVGRTGGFLWTDSDSFIHIDNDLNALDAAKRGYQPNGALFLKGPTVGWFEFDTQGKPCEAKSVFVEFSTQKIKATDLSFSFSWSEGDADGDCCWGFPAEWRVQCSIDGSPWVNLQETATGEEIFLLRSHPWWDKVLNQVSGRRQTGFDCGLGMQQRSFRLPSEAIGRARVVLRLTPATGRISLIRSRPSDDVLSTNTISPDKDFMVTWLRFGQVMVEYR
ncbi:MAG: hypothetical protein J6X69_03360 [Bacteroidales bacterium]|nr:hypothetical protein [Bacteroidales bacterium]